MLSHGLCSGCHGDRLLKFAFRIQPEFPGNLNGRTQHNNSVLESSLCQACWVQRQARMLANGLSHPGESQDPGPESGLLPQDLVGPPQLWLPDTAAQLTDEHVRV